MSVAVDLDRLRAEVERFGTRPYLLTVTDDQRPHAVAITVEWMGDALVASVGRSTAANATARPDVTLLWPPVDDDGFSLIVDGRAQLDADRVQVRPARAILHRQAAGGPGSDCVKLE